MRERIDALDIVNGKHVEVGVFFQDSLEDTQGFIEDLRRFKGWINPPTIYMSFFTNGRWVYSTEAQHHNPLLTAAAQIGLSRFHEIARLQIGGEYEDVTMYIPSHPLHRDNYETVRDFIPKVMEGLHYATGSEKLENLTAQIVYPNISLDRRNPFRGRLVKFDGMLPPRRPAARRT